MFKLFCLSFIFCLSNLNFVPWLMILDVIMCLGCVKFLESYYLILVTKRRQIGCICGHAIYSIDESQLISIPHTSIQTDIAHSKPEMRYYISVV